MNFSCSICEGHPQAVIVSIHQIKHSSLALTAVVDLSERPLLIVFLFNELVE
jgi:hypothetical protein